MRLRSLVVVTGTVRLSGGETSEQSTAADGRGRVVMQRKVVSPDRQKALSIVSAFLKKIGRLALLRTPFGLLLDPDDVLTSLKPLLEDVDGKIKDFTAHAQSTQCTLINAVVWEPLAGNRKARIEAWLDAHAADPDVAAFLAKYAAD